MSAGHWREPYPRFCQPGCFQPATAPSSISTHAVTSCPVRAPAVYGLPGVTRPHPHCCDEIQPSALADMRPNPLALLPVARSPSRVHHCTRWWALTPPFHPSLYQLNGPKASKRTAGLLSVAVVVSCALPGNRPHLLFRVATLPDCSGGESGSSSARNACSDDNSAPLFGC